MNPNEYGKSVINSDFDFNKKTAYAKDNRVMPQNILKQQINIDQNEADI